MKVVSAVKTPKSVHDVVDVASGQLRGATDQARQALVRIRLAQQVDGLAGEQSRGRVVAVLGSHVVPEAREDDPVHRPILRLPAAWPQQRSPAWIRRFSRQASRVSGRGAARARWPSPSSKRARSGNPRLGRFDSCAAPLEVYRSCRQICGVGGSSPPDCLRWRRGRHRRLLSSRRV